MPSFQIASQHLDTHLPVANFQVSPTFIHIRQVIYVHVMLGELLLAIIFCHMLSWWIVYDEQTVLPADIFHVSKCSRCMLYLLHLVLPASRHRTGPHVVPSQ